MEPNVTPVQSTTNVLQHAEPAATAAQNAGREVNRLTPLHALAIYKLLEWAKIFSTTIATVMVLVFIGLDIADYFASKDVYTEIAGKYFGWVIALVIIAITVPISELLRKTFGEQKRWDVFNRKLESPEKSNEEIQREVNDDARKDLTKGLIALLFMTGIILALSYHRKVNLQHKEFDVLDLLPALLFIAAAWCGVYFSYIWKRIITWFRARSLRKQIEIQTDICQYETRKAHGYYEQARKGGEDVQSISADLSESLYRFRNKGSLDGSFTTKDNLHTCAVLVKDGNKPVSGALVLGRTPASEYSQIVQTDNLGRATLQWVGHTALSQISVNYIPHEGLWRSGDIATIDIVVEEATTQKNYSSNGQHAQDVSYTEIKS